MKNKIALIGAIEGTLDRMLEKNYLLLVKTLRRNGGKYKDIDIHLLQPTNHDILETTKAELIKYNVNFIKCVSDYNQDSRDFNYTNKPIACNYFYSTLRENYDYFLWIDGDAAVLSEMQLPQLTDNEIVYTHNNEFYDCKLKCYVQHDCADFNDDIISYADLVFKISHDDNNYVPTHSWFIYAKADCIFWKSWNELTRAYIEKINSIGKHNFRFFNKYDNFQNRVEELTMDIIIKNNNLYKVYPSNIHTFTTPDSEYDDEYIECYNDTAWLVHYDEIAYMKNTESQVAKYFMNNSYLKSQIIYIYQMNIYKQLFTTHSYA